MFRGLRNRDIAEAMGISAKTVEVHMHRILLKLGARNRSQAIVNSLGLGYLPGIAVPIGPRGMRRTHVRSRRHERLSEERWKVRHDYYPDPCAAGQDYVFPPTNSPGCHNATLPLIWYCEAVV